MTQEAPMPAYQTDYSQMIQMVAKPVVSSLLTLLAAAGAIHAIPGAAVVNAICVFIGALGNAAVWGWAYLHSRAIDKQKVAVGAAGYAAGLVLPQQSVNVPQAMAAGVQAVAQVKAK